MDGRYAGFAGAKTGHGLVPLLWCFIILRLRWIPFSAPGWCYMASVFAIRVVRYLDENAMESGQIHSWPGYQGGQFTNEIQRFKNHMSGAMPNGQSTSWATLSIRSAHGASLRCKGF